MFGSKPQGCGCTHRHGKILHIEQWGKAERGHTLPYDQLAFVPFKAICRDCGAEYHAKFRLGQEAVTVIDAQYKSDLDGWLKLSKKVDELQREKEMLVDKAAALTNQLTEKTQDCEQQRLSWIDIYKAAATQHEKKVAELEAQLKRARSKLVAKKRRK